MRIKRWLVTGVYGLNLLSIGVLVIVHIASWWGIALDTIWVMVPIMFSGMVVFFAGAEHQVDQMVIARYGEKPTRYPMTFAEFFEKQGRYEIVSRELHGLGYIRTAPITMPCAPRWLIRLAVILMVAWLPYNILNGYLCLLTSPFTGEAMLTRYGTAWVSFLFFPSLPILYSWQREVMIEPDS